ncbi:MAG TPA: HlyD family efflux transporter periplasmic adaptor subunit, partial [Chloroflexota bacterium]
SPPATPSPDGRSRRRFSLAERWRRLPRVVRWGLVVLALLVVVIVVARQVAPASSPPPASPTSVPAPRLVAHGLVQPISQARVGTLGGGVLLGVSVTAGEAVTAQTELARVRGPAEVEVLTAPFAGTVTGLLAHTGDTLLPGAGVIMVADLSRLQVETTDVDEFLIGHIHPGQTVSLQVEALDRRELSGRVRSISLQPQTTSGGDQQYPVTIDLGGAPPDLRPGMSVRITLAE